MFVGCTVLSLLVVSGVFVTRTQSASGDVTTVGGGAYGESVNVRTILGANVVSGPAPTVTLPPEGGGPFTNQLAGVDVPNLLSISLLDVSTQGTPGPTGSSESSASVTTLSLANGAVTADLVKSTCRSDSFGSSGTTTLANVKVAGVPLVDLNPPPNQTIDIPLVGTLILNEQTGTSEPGSTNITVNAIHLRLNSAVLGTGDIIISQSRCEAAGPNVIIPVGAIGGVGLAVVLGAVFVWRMTRRRPAPEGAPIPAG